LAVGGTVDGAEERSSAPLVTVVVDLVLGEFTVHRHAQDLVLEALGDRDDVKVKDMPLPARRWGDFDGQKWRRFVGHCQCSGICGRMMEVGCSGGGEILFANTINKPSRQD